MPRFIVKLADDEYVEWSTVVDAPLAGSVTRAAACHEWGEPSVARADRRGHSQVEGPRVSEANRDRVWSPEELIAGNRAGPGESELSLDELRAAARRASGTEEANDG